MSKSSPRRSVHQATPKWRRLPLVLSVLLLVVSCHTAPAAPPDAPERFVLAEGTRWETPYYVRDSRTQGPTVVVVGGVHGDEPAGPLAADQIRLWPVVRGKLVVLPRANRPALRAGTRNTPDVEKALQNLNRNFPKRTSTDSPRGPLATVLWRWLKTTRPDWVVDLHEGFSFHQLNPKTVGSSVIVHAAGEADKVAPLLLDAVNATVTDEKKKFVRLQGKGDGYLASAAASRLRAQALICETTIQSQPRSLRTRQHRVMVHRLLTHLEMLPDGATHQWLVEHDRPPGHVAIAYYDARGTAGRGARHLAGLLSRQPDVSLACVGPPELTDDVLRQFDVVVFPGGSGSRQARAIGPNGRQAVARFVRNGGGYLGICAGAYLATSKFSWGLKILDAQTVSPKWRRGKGLVKVELTDDGRRLLHWNKAVMSIRYHNGPILMPSGSETLPDYQTLAFFRSEVAENDAPKGIMVDSPAIVAGRYGRGRVLCLSPHAEGSAEEAILLRAVAWLAGGNDS